MLALALSAFFAGILMFLAPCTLPIVPGYLAFISAIPEGTLARDSRRRLLMNSVAFVLGFSVVFILLGVFAGYIGSLLGPWRYAISRIGGAILVVFGITMLGSFTVPGLSQDIRWRLPSFLSIGRWESSLLIGILFALGWSPCIGPILGGILFLASSQATAASGAILLAIFSLGLALPFLLTALLIDHAGRVLSRLGPLARAMQILGALFLILIGILMLFNMMGILVAWGFGWLEMWGYGRLLQYL